MPANKAALKLTATAMALRTVFWSLVMCTSFLGQFFDAEEHALEYHRDGSRESQHREDDQS
jgi:hypothetical protein